MRRVIRHQLRQALELLLDKELVEHAAVARHAGCHQAVPDLALLRHHGNGVTSEGQHINNTHHTATHTHVPWLTGRLANKEGANLLALEVAGCLLPWQVGPVPRVLEERWAPAGLGCRRCFPAKEGLVDEGKAAEDSLVDVGNGIRVRGRELGGGFCKLGVKVGGGARVLALRDVRRRDLQGMAHGSGK